MNRFGGYEDRPWLAELYDLVKQYGERGDTDFYVDFCREADGPVLELGCGTGRVLLPVARAGVEITGLDLSSYMLEKCREKLAEEPVEVRERVTLIQGSMTDFDLDDEFAAVIIPFRTLQHLIEVKDQIDCLRRICAHLEPGGRLAFDVFQPNMRKIIEGADEEEREDMPELKLPRGRTLRRCNRVTATHLADQVREVEIIYYVTDKKGQEQRLVQPFPFRYFFRYELEHLLKRCGFKDVQTFGDFDRSPLTDDSQEMVFVAKTSPERDCDQCSLFGVECHGHDEFNHSGSGI